MAYRVKDWKEKQHYKDRNPTWIKLHIALLTSYRFHSLSLASKALAPMLWLLASTNKDPTSGLIPGSLEEIVFHVHIPIQIVKDSINELIEKDYLELVQDASNSIAELGQVAIPEKETEKETQEKKEEDYCGLGASAPPPRAAKPEKKIVLELTGEIENDQNIPEKAIFTLTERFELPEEWGEYAEKLGWVNGQILSEAEKFKAYWIFGKGSGKRRSKKGWRQSWSNWLENAAKFDRIGGKT